MPQSLADTPGWLEGLKSSKPYEKEGDLILVQVQKQLDVCVIYLSGSSWKPVIFKNPVQCPDRRLDQVLRVQGNGLSEILRNTRHEA